MKPLTLLNFIRNNNSYKLSLPILLLSYEIDHNFYYMKNLSLKSVDKGILVPQNIATKLLKTKRWKNKKSLFKDIDNTNIYNKKESFKILRSKKILVLNNEKKYKWFDSDIIIVGCGLKPFIDITLEAKLVIQKSDLVIIANPYRSFINDIHWLNKNVVLLTKYFDPLYIEKYGRKRFKLIAEEIFKICKRRKNKKISWAVYGNPMVGCTHVEYFLNLSKNKIKVKIISGLSFLEDMFVICGIEPADGFFVADIKYYIQNNITPLICNSIIMCLGYKLLNVKLEEELKILKSYLLKYCPLDYKIKLVSFYPMSYNYKVDNIILSKIENIKKKMLDPQKTSLFLPKLKK